MFEDTQWTPGHVGLTSESWVVRMYFQVTVRANSTARLAIINRHTQKKVGISDSLPQNSRWYSQYRQQCRVVFKNPKIEPLMIQNHTAEYRSKRIENWS